MAWLSAELYTYNADERCQAVLMALKILKVDYEEKLVDLMKAENKRPWFIRINPLQEVPSFSDQGYIISESRAILQYLCNKYCTDGNQYLYPKEPEIRGTVDKFLFFDMGTLSYSINQYFKPRLFQGGPPDADVENLMKQSLDYLDGFVEKTETPFLCGEKPTIADITILASIATLEALDYSYKAYGEVTRYVQRLKACLPFKECCEPGMKALKANLKILEADYKKQTEKERKSSMK